VGIQRPPTGSDRLLRDEDIQGRNDDENMPSEANERWDAHSPSGTASNSFDALSLSSRTGTSIYATPRSTFSTLPTPTAAEYANRWDYTRSNASAYSRPHSRSQSGSSLRRGEDSDDDCEEEGQDGVRGPSEGGTRRVSGPGVSNMRGTPRAGGSESSAAGSPGMDVDG
jgi:hypothetical protein